MKIDHARSVALARSPFLGSILLGAKIVVQHDMNLLAATDGRRTIFVNPKLLKRPIHEIVAVLIHEAMHLALRHHSRLGNRDADIWNVATDCVINGILLDEKFRLPENSVTPQYIAEIIDVSVKRIREMTAEEVYYELVEKAPPRWLMSLRCGLNVIHSYHPDESDVEEHWKNVIHRAHVISRVAGYQPSSGALRLFTIQREHVTSWLSKVRNAVMHGVGTAHISTWLRPSRRMPDAAPGSIRIGIPRIIFAIDTSLSISEDELNRACSLVYEISKSTNSEVWVYFWDTITYGPQRFTSPSQVLANMKPQGGGGTVILPLAKELVKVVRSTDVVVVVTDGHIYDINNPEVAEQLVRIASRAAKVIILTFHAKPDVRGWEVITAK